MPRSSLAKLQRCTDRLVFGDMPQSINILYKHTKGGKTMKRTKESKLKGMKDFLREEEGMGTVEIILIIVEIFTLRKQGILC